MRAGQDDPGRSARSKGAVCLVSARQNLSYPNVVQSVPNRCDVPRSVGGRTRYGSIREDTRFATINQITEPGKESVELREGHRQVDCGWAAGAIRGGDTTHLHRHLPAVSVVRPQEQRMPGLRVRRGTACDRQGRGSRVRSQYGACESLTPAIAAEDRYGNGELPESEMVGLPASQPACLTAIASRHYLHEHKGEPERQE